MTLHAIKSNGMDHAKWSPVGTFPVPAATTEKETDGVYLIATAAYRLMPHIQIAPEGIPSRLCDKFAQCFAPGVIEVKTNRSTGAISLRARIFIHLHFGTVGKKEVVLKNPRRDTVSREVLRHPEFENLVKLGRIRDHFLCEFLHRAIDIFLMFLLFRVD